MKKSSPYTLDKKTIQGLSKTFKKPPDKTQRTINEYIITLKELGISQDKIEKKLSLILNDIENQVLFEIKSKFNEKDKNNWENFLNKNPNEAQRLIILSEFYKKKTRESIEDLQNRITIKIFKHERKAALREYDITNKINNLTEKQTEKALKLLKNGDFEKAQSIIEPYNKF